MDPNYWERRRTEELERAEAATCEASRAAHNGLAALYAAVIDGTMNLPQSNEAEEPDEDFRPLGDAELDEVVGARRTTVRDSHDKYANND